MTTTVFVAISFACQILFVSLWIPRALAGVAKESMGDRWDQADSVRGQLKRYRWINNIVAGLGSVCLGVCLVLHYRGDLAMTGLLLSIGIVFLVQVLPTAALFYPGWTPFYRDINKHTSTLPGSEDVPKLFDLLPRLPAVVAVGLFFAYVGTTGAHWVSTGINQAPKIVSITFTNCVCLFALLLAYRRIVREQGERAERIKELVRMGPILLFASILVTIYFFAKEVLFAFDLEEARPIMMSVALQLVAMGVLYSLAGLRKQPG